MSFKSYPTCGILLRQPKWTKKIHFGEIEIFYIIIMVEFLIYIFLKAQQIVHLKLVILLFVNYFSIELIFFFNINVKPLLLLLLSLDHPN